ESGFFRQKAAEDIEKSAKIEKIAWDELNRIYREIGHEFVSFLKLHEKACHNESGKYVHYGITTHNIQQRSKLYIMKNVHVNFIKIVGQILENLSVIAYDNKDVVMPGRTHGRHAIPITYGYKVSAWISEFIMSYERMAESEKRVFQVMMG